MPEPAPDLVEFRLGLTRDLSKSLSVTTTQSTILSLKRTDSQVLATARLLTYTMEL